MAPRHQRIHVETIQRAHGERVYTQYLLRSSYREGGKVMHRTYGNLSHLPEDIVELIRRALRGEQFVPVTSAFEIRRTLSHGHVAAVLGMARRLGLDRRWPQR